MTTAKALKMQIDLANTAHQREVADLQAAGLNPILSANGSGAAVPNLSGFATSSGSKTSARAAIKLAKLDPTSKAIDTANNAVNQIAEMAKKVSNMKAVKETHPERINSANEAALKNQQNVAHQIYNANQRNQNMQNGQTNSGLTANQNQANYNAMNYILNALGVKGFKITKDNWYLFGLGQEILRRAARNMRDNILREYGY